MKKPALPFPSDVLFRSWLARAQAQEALARVERHRATSLSLTIRHPAGQPTLAEVRMRREAQREGRWRDLAGVGRGK